MMVRTVNCAVAHPVRSCIRTNGGGGKFWKKDASVNCGGCMRVSRSSRQHITTTRDKRNTEHTPAAARNALSELTSEMRPRVVTPCNVVAAYSTIVSIKSNRGLDKK